jgi:putative phage-type endonuclease
MSAGLVADVVKMGLGKDKKHLRHYAEQLALVAGSWGEREASRFCFERTAARRARDRARAAALLELPQAPQGSDEWFAFRRGRRGADGVMAGGHLTASDTGTILGLNPYGSADEVLVNKCGDDTFDWSPACQHGTCYEDVTLAIYTRRTGKEVREYGCIPGKGCEAASPDGVTPCGLAVEIKNPSSRKITGVPKPMYYAQVQQQLEVLDLEECHFVETSIDEYADARAFAADCPAGEPEAPYTAAGMEKGVLVEVCTRGAGAGDRPRFRYLYAPIDLGPSAAGRWVEEALDGLGELAENQSVLVKHWHCRVFCNTRILRDRAWWAAHLPAIEAFWRRVEETRRDPALLERARAAYRAFKEAKERRFGRRRRSSPPRAGGAKSRTRTLCLNPKRRKGRSKSADTSATDFLFGPEEDPKQQQQQQRKKDRGAGGGSVASAGGASATDFLFGPEEDP